MQFEVVTLFPQLFAPFRETGVLGRAIAAGIVELELHDLRDWAGNRWRQVDDEPYGGGAGMVIQAPPVISAVRDLQARAERRGRLVMLSPRGRVLDHTLARELSAEHRILVLCGRYEGFDERVAEILGAEEVSVGDYILGGGEVGAMVVIEAVTRLLPGVVGDPQSVAEDSFAAGLLDYPAYTRPAEVEGHTVPEVLVSGDHGAVRRWRLEKAVELTVTRRPDLIRKHWEWYPEEVKDLVRHLAPDLAD
ncbi:MAG: tRNA (guanosine(37)-N1)-methyltransferase TrmD [Acidobacteria bacterium]|nr:tRNA (guanosine(37)-N1)-methyltransferase TrmD [Acidobacteriota bacterium]